MDNLGMVVLNQENDLPVAPLWHTGMLFVLLLMLPMLPYFGNLSIHGRFHAGDFHIGNFSRSMSASLLALSVECGLFVFLYVGLLLARQGFSALIGKRWHRFSDVVGDISWGVAIAFAAFMVTGLSLYFTHNLAPSNSGLMPHTLIEKIWFILMLVSGAVIEELLFRGYLLKQMVHFLDNPVASICIQAVIFALAHAAYENLAAAVSKLIIGLALGFLTIKRHSLLPAIVAHSLMNSIAAIAIISS